MDEAILLRYLRGESDEEEIRAVEEWSETVPENRKRLEQLYYILFVGERVDVLARTDTESSLKAFKKRIHRKEEQHRRSRFYSRWQRYAGFAAAFLAGLLFAGGLTYGFLSGRWSDYTVRTAPGQRAQAILPDGSKVWLNASTTLTYRNSVFSPNREINLTGEAYFEVAHRKGEPFTVNSKRIKTRVLGTKFNVRAREEEDRVMTTLLQGSVNMASPGNEDGYLLKPGQTMNINTTNYRAELIEYNRPADVLVWMTGHLRFNRSTLLEITNQLEKLHDVRFVYTDPSLKTERFTGNFSTDNTPDDILNVLSQTNHLDYRREGKTIHLLKSE